MAYTLKNEKVKSLVGIDFVWNIIPSTWYAWILRDTSWFDKGKWKITVDLIAINLLSEILYWYRPCFVRDEEMKQDVAKQKISWDLLQKNYKQLEEKFWLTTKQIRDWLITLEKNNLITRVFADVSYDIWVIRKVMYIDINVEKIIDISSRIPTEEDFYHWLRIRQPLFTNSWTMPDEFVLDTEITTEITTKSSLLSKDNEPIGSKTVEKENPIINNIANNKEEIQWDTNVHTTVQATLLDHRAKLDKFFKEDITDEQFEEEATTERWMETLGEKWYEDEYIQVEEVIKKNQQEVKPKREFWNKDVNEMLMYLQKKFKQHWMILDNSQGNRNSAKHFTQWKFQELVEESWCKDRFDLIDKIIDWAMNFEYAPRFSNLQQLYKKKTDIYNALVRAWKRESSTNPTTQRFEEFYAIYPKREWYAEAKEWYAINVRKKEKHDEIMQWTKEFVKKVWKEQKDITFLPSANTYLVKERWYDTLPDKLQDDDVVYERAYESWDPEILREHLKLKYWEDFSKREELDHVCIYWQEKKTAIECKNQTPII